MAAGRVNHSETSAKFNPLALSPGPNPHPTAQGIPQGPRFPTSPLQGFSSDPPPWPMRHGSPSTIQGTGMHRAPAHRKAVLEWNLLDPKESGQDGLPHPKTSVWHRKRELSWIIKVLSWRPEYHLNLNTVDCWLLQLDLVWFPPEPRQPGRCLLHSPRGPCQDDCARCWALRVICYLHGSSSKILQGNRTYWSLLNPSASFTPLLTCSSSPTWHFPPSPSPPLGGMSTSPCISTMASNKGCGSAPEEASVLSTAPLVLLVVVWKQLMLVSELKIGALSKLIPIII